MENLNQIYDFMHDQFFDSRKRIFWIYLISSISIALLWLKYKERKKFLCAFKQIFNPNLYLSKSAKADYFLAIINQIFFILISPYLISQLFIASIFFQLLHNLQFGPQILFGYFSNLVVSIIFTITYFVLDDFARYFVHKLLHKLNILWIFHKVHHSAQVLTPITVYRTHPVEAIIFFFRGAIMQSFLITGFVYLFGNQVDLITIFSANIFAFIFNFAGSNLRHSHIKIHYWNWLEKIIISPYQHQLHHSNSDHHYNKNFGVFFAFWDSFFGTLELSKNNSIFEFGLNKKEKHILSNSVFDLYFIPMYEFFCINKNLLKKIIYKIFYLTKKYFFRWKFSFHLGKT